MLELACPATRGNTPNLLPRSDAAKWAGTDNPRVAATLGAVHRSWGLPDDRLIRWLLDQGVNEYAMLEPWPLGGTRVRFDGYGFDVVLDGELAITFRVEDTDVLDIAAWAPQSGRLASWRGVAFALGQDSIFNPASYFTGSALRVHRTPLDWLKADRDGIVMVKPELTYAYLRNAQRLSFRDDSLARQVRRWIEPPKPRVQLLIEVPAA
jgi:hypothetical protein